MKRDRRGQNGNNAARYYFLFTASDQPPTRNTTVFIHPWFIPIFCSGMTVTSAPLCEAHWWWQLSTFVFQFPSARSTPFMDISLFYVRAIFFLWQIIYFHDRLWDIPSATEDYAGAGDAVTRRNGNGSIIDYMKNRYRRIRGDHEFMRYYGTAANGFTYPFITELVEVKFGYRVLTRQLTRINDLVRPCTLNYFSLSIALFADVDAIISR